MLNMNELHEKLSLAGIPVIGISIGRKNDSSTWRIDFAPGATDEHKDRAAQIVADFDINKVSHNENIDRQIAALEATVTPRRMREAVRGSGKAWLDSVDDQINALRSQRV